MKIDIRDSNNAGTCQFCNRDKEPEYRVLVLSGKTQARLCLDCFKKVCIHIAEETRGDTNKSN